MDDLVARARSGDGKALEALFESFLPRIYRFISLKIGTNNPQVEDLVQETFIGAMGSINRLRGDDEAALSRWLISIARYKVADHFRASYANRDEVLDERAGEADPAASVTAEDIAVDRAASQDLRAALARLTPDQEEVLTLKFILDYDNETVARIIGKPVGAVKSLQHRGLNSLQRMLGPGSESWN